VRARRPDPRGGPAPTHVSTNAIGRFRLAARRRPRSRAGPPGARLGTPLAHRSRQMPPPRDPQGRPGSAQRRAHRPSGSGAAGPSLAAPVPDPVPVCPERTERAAIHAFVAALLEEIVEPPRAGVLAGSGIDRRTRSAPDSLGNGPRGSPGARSGPDRPRSPPRAAPRAGRSARRRGSRADGPRRCSSRAPGGSRRPAARTPR